MNDLLSGPQEQGELKQTLHRHFARSEDPLERNTIMRNHGIIYILDYEAIAC